MFSFPEDCKVVVAAAPQVGVPGVVTGTAVSLKNVEKLWAIVLVNPVGGGALVLTPQTDTLVAFGSAAALTPVCRIWANEAVGTNDRLVEQTSAVNYTTAADANVKQVIFEIDPARLTADERAFRVITGALPNTDFVSIVYVMSLRYPSRVLTAPTVLTD